MKFSRTSWKTASAGILSITVALIGYIGAWVSTGQYPGEIATIAAVTAILNGIGNLVARDNDKTSDEVGATLFEKERDRIEQTQG